MNTSVKDVETFADINYNILNKILLAAGIIQCCFYNIKAQSAGARPPIPPNGVTFIVKMEKNKDVLGIFSTEAPVYLSGFYPNAIQSTGKQR